MKYLAFLGLTIMKPNNPLQVLSEKGIIAPPQLKVLEHRFKNEAQQEYKELINFLYPIFYEKTFLRSCTSNWHPCFFPKEHLSVKEKKLRQQASEGILEALLQCNLIGQAAFSEIRQKIDQSLILYELETFISATTLQQFNESFTVARQLAFIDEFLLYWINGASQEQVHQLKQQVCNHKLASYLDYFTYSHDALVLHSADLPKELGTFISTLCWEIGKMTTGFLFSQLKYEVVKQNHAKGDHISTLFVNVSFLVNKHRYKQAVIIQYHQAPDEKKSFFWLVEGLEQLFNQVLADHNAPYRMVLVQAISKYDRHEVNKDRFVLLRVSRQDLNLFSLKRQELFLRFSNVSYKNSLTHFQLLHALEIYKKARLFEHLREKEVRQTEKKLFQKSYAYFSEMLAEFPDVICILNHKILNTHQPYRRCLKKLSAISGGRFHPTDINDGFNPKFTVKDNETFKLTFHCNGKKYATSLSSNHNQFDYHFLSLVKQALEDQHSSTRLYDLVNSEQGEYLIFLNKKQYRLLSDKKVLEFLNSGRV